MAEVLEAVVLGLVGEFGIGDPRFFELVEQELVDVGEVGPEAVVELLDDESVRQNTWSRSSAGSVNAVIRETNPASEE